MAWHHRHKLVWVPQIAQNVDIIFISVKPQYVATVITEMKEHLTGKHIMVSIAAGIPLSVMKVSFLVATYRKHNLAEHTNLPDMQEHNLAEHTNFLSTGCGWRRQAHN